MKYYSSFIVLITLFASCSSKENKEEAPTGKTAAAAVYQLATVEEGGVSSKIKLPAQLAAFQEVSIFPKVNAYVTKVLVDIGTKVSKGTLLMQLEAPELMQAVLQAKEKYSRTRSDLSLDKEHYRRLLEASQTAGAVSPIDLSTARAKVEADSALCNSEKANWLQQQSMLDYLKVTAPFDGVITERNVHPGALVNAVTKDRPMLELKQVSHLRLQVDIPESLAAGIKNADTISFFTSAFPGKKMKGLVSRKSSSINTQYRSERMEIDVANTNGLLSPGMFAEVLFEAAASAGAMSVPKSSVVTSTERKYVLVKTGESIKKTDVSTGRESADRIEVFGSLQPGDKVIVNANDEIREHQ